MNEKEKDNFKDERKEKTEFPTLTMRPVFGEYYKAHSQIVKS